MNALPPPGFPAVSAPISPSTAFANSPDTPPAKGRTLALERVEVEHKVFLMALHDNARGRWA
jgi:hypothetical protein